MLLWNWHVSAPELMLGSEVVGRTDRFTYLGSLISPGALVSGELSAQTQKSRSAFVNLHHLWRRRDIHLLTKDEFTVHQFAPFHFMDVKYTH